MVKKDKSEAKPRKKAEKKSVAKPKLITMDDVYRLISRVQLNKKEVNFWLAPEDSIVASNVLKDLDLKFDVKELKNRVSFTVHPNEEEAINEEAMDVDVDFFQDEIPEDGQLF